MAEVNAQTISGDSIDDRLTRHDSIKVQILNLQNDRYGRTFIAVEGSYFSLVLFADSLENEANADVLSLRISRAEEDRIRCLLELIMKQQEYEEYEKVE